MRNTRDLKQKLKRKLTILERKVVMWMRAPSSFTAERVMEAAGIHLTPHTSSFEGTLAIKRGHYLSRLYPSVPIRAAMIRKDVFEMEALQYGRRLTAQANSNMEMDHYAASNVMDRICRSGTDTGLP